MLKRIGIGLGVVLTLLIALALYFIYTPIPALPTAPVEKLTLEQAGLTRSYSVFVPGNLQAGASILFALHPSRSSGEQMRRFAGNVLERVAEQENLIVVYPDGFEGHFNDCRLAASYSARTLNIDDVGFIQAIIKQLVADKQANPARVFALGYSNGGQMALRLGLEAPQLVKGVASIAANLPAPDNMACKVATEPARFVAFIEGSKDPVNPYEGGQAALFGMGNRGTVLSANDSAKWFANLLKLTTAPAATSLAEVAGVSAQQQDWQAGDGHVRLVSIIGGGHTVPQAAYSFPRILGATYQSDAVLESLVKMFTSAQ